MNIKINLLPQIAFDFIKLFMVYQFVEPERVNQFYN
jgi:hypothetical protein